ALQLREEEREWWWASHQPASEMKLHWRACSLQHCFHVVPGERILELGAGSGLWTEILGEFLRHEDPITAVSFTPEHAERGRARQIPNTTFVTLADLDELPAETFHYVVGCAMLWHDQLPELLASIYRV